MRKRVRLLAISLLLLIVLVLIAAGGYLYFRKLQNTPVVVPVSSQSRLLEFSKAITESGYSFESTPFEEKGTITASISGAVVYFSATKDFKTQVKALQLLIRSHKMDTAKPKEIDLRFEKNYRSLLIQMAKDKVITAIDVGSSKITTVIAASVKDEKLSVVGVSTVPSRGMRKGQVVDIEEAVSSISESVDAAERMAGVSVGSAVVSVGGAHVSSQNSKGVVAVSQPQGEITPSDVKRVIDAARAVSIPSSREILHVLPRDFAVDGQAGIKDPVGMTGVRLEVDTQIVTGATTAVRNLAKCIGEVGIDIEAVAFSGLASGEAVLSDTERELGVILVDIGAGTTDVAIWVDGALSYSAVLPVGARNVTNDIAVGLRVSLESAEKIKLFLSETMKPKFAVEPLGIETKAKSTDELDLSSLDLSEEVKKVSRKTLIDGIIKPRLLEIFTFVSLEVQKSGFTGMTPSGVVITGGGALTAGVLESSRARLSMPCRIGAPFTAPNSQLSGLIEELSSPQFAAPVGLILFAGRSGPQSEGSAREQGGSLPKMPGFGNIGQKLGVAGIGGKITKLLKSFLP